MANLTYGPFLLALLNTAKKNLILKFHQIIDLNMFGMNDLWSTMVFLPSLTAADKHEPLERVLYIHMNN